MLNQYVVAGRVASYEKNILTVSIPLPVEKGEEPRCAIIPFVVPKGLSKPVEEYISKGDIVGVKAHLENKGKSLICIAEKISFLSSKKIDNKGEYKCILLLKRKERDMLLTNVVTQ